MLYRVIIPFSLFIVACVWSLMLSYLSCKLWFIFTLLKRLVLRWFVNCCYLPRFRWQFQPIWGSLFLRQSCKILITWLCFNIFWIVAVLFDHSSWSQIDWEILIQNLLLLFLSKMVLLSHFWKFIKDHLVFLLIIGCVETTMDISTAVTFEFPYLQVIFEIHQLIRIVFFHGRNRCLPSFIQFLFQSEFRNIRKLVSITRTWYCFSIALYLFKFFNLFKQIMKIFTRLYWSFRMCFAALLVGWLPQCSVMLASWNVFW